MSKIMVQTEDLTKIFPEGNVVALDHVNLTIEEGEFISIMGPSGSGKTTLLNMLGALDRPTSGRVIVDEMDLSKVKNLDRFRAEKVGFVFQMYNLIPTVNSLLNVQIPMCETRISPRQRRERAQELLEVVGLKDRMRHLPAMLSGGERQRVAIARALANNPSIVLADEPTGTLDSRLGAEIVGLMRELNKSRGTTLIIVTHDLDVARVADRAIHIIDGKIREE